MNGRSPSDHLRRVVDSWTRRRTLAALSGSVLAGVGELVGGGAPSGAAARPVANRRRGRNKARECRQLAVDICTERWPDDFDACKAGLNECCEKALRCKEGKARRCIEESEWF